MHVFLLPVATKCLVVLLDSFLGQVELEVTVTEINQACDIVCVQFETGQQVLLSLLIIACFQQQLAHRSERKRISLNLDCILKQLGSCVVMLLL